MRIFIYLSLVIIAPLLAAVFGFIHDQITYSICPEFFQKIRFDNYPDLPEGWHDRTKAGMIGVLNSWKIGIPLGLLLTAVATIHKKLERILSYTLTTYGMTIIITFISVMVGLFTSEALPKNWTPLEGINDQLGLYKVMNMNNFAYMGGVIGMFLGLTYHLFRYKRDNKRNPEEGTQTA
jgi:hypothetical protein